MEAAYIWTPPKVLGKIIDQLHAEYSFEYDEMFVPCARVAGLPDMVIGLDGLDQRISSKQYTRQVSINED